MTRWLQAAIQAQDPKAKTDETDGTRAKVERAGRGTTKAGFVSCVSFVSRVRARNAARPHRAQRPGCSPSWRDGGDVVRCLGEP